MRDDPRHCATSLARRRWLRAAPALVLGTLAGGCAERGPLRIGFIGGMSGRVADLGIGGRNGTQLALEALGERGGLRGRPLELLARDDEMDTAVALQRFDELADAGVAFVVGPMTSAVAVALAPRATERRVALLSPTATTNELSGRADAFFRVVPDAPSGARQQAQALLARGLRRLITVTDLRNRAFAQDWTSAAARQFEAGGGQALRDIGFEAAPGVQFAELAERVAGSGADAALLAASAADSALLAQQVRLRAPGMVLALSAWAGTEQLLALGGRALDGVLVMQYFDRASRAPPYLEFVERYRGRFGEAPGYPAVNAYDATMLGAAALQAAGTATPAALLQTLAGVREHEGLQRRLTLDAQGDCNAPSFLTEIRDGRYVPTRG